MKTTLDLSTLEWTLSGFNPEQWRSKMTMETNVAVCEDVPPVPARVPGSVQGALHAAGLLPDWNIGLNARACEWVENRHWLFETHIPAEWIRAHAGETIRLDCQGLDGFGKVFVNGAEAGEFKCSFVPHVYDVTSLVDPSKDNRLQIVFTSAPRWLGQLGETSKMTEWKVRFNYGWDWTSRIVQFAVSEPVSLVATGAAEFAECRALAGFKPGEGGTLRAWGVVDGGADGADVEIVLRDSRGAEILSRRIPAESFATGIDVASLPVEPWWPATEGAQPLYALSFRLLGADGRELDRADRTVGFKGVEWRQCEGAPAGADPWICVVNGRPVFLRGIDWTPVRSVFADVTPDMVRSRLELYRDIGCNVLRVWGGAVLGDETFFSLCDELGLLVWQEFPLSSAGIENWPPEDPVAIAELYDIARSYIVRRQHHASLLLWCGGNELQGTIDGAKTGVGKPVTKEHPLMARWDELVAREDPGRRFLETSSSGPRFYATKEENCKGLHWDVHGPWDCGDMGEWRDYWDNDDALFRSETGCPGASPVDILEYTAGGMPLMPCDLSNPLWRRSFWWIHWQRFIDKVGRAPNDIAEFVAWSQKWQADALAYAARVTRERFPRIGGMILWMGHDAFPCTSNTSIVDFYGRPKPAALALKEIWAK